MRQLSFIKQVLVLLLFASGFLNAANEYRCSVVKKETNELVDAIASEGMTTNLRVGNEIIGTIKYDIFYGMNPSREYSDQEKKKWNAIRAQYPNLLRIKHVKFVDNLKRNDYERVGTALMALALIATDNEHRSSAAFYSSNNLPIPPKSKIALLALYSAIGFYKKLGFDFFEELYAAEHYGNHGVEAQNIPDQTREKDFAIFTHAESYANSSANRGIWLILNNDDILRQKAKDLCAYEEP